MTSLRYGLLSYPGVFNLGDPIQSLAARHFLPRVDVTIPRERLADKPPGSGPIGLIANGWFMENPANWPPHPDIIPLLISMHFAETSYRRFERFRRRPLDRLLAGAGAEYLRYWGPVGARDQFTADELSKRDIPNFVSGCLTMTLERQSDAPRGDFIVACDLAPQEVALLRKISGGEVVLTSHRGRLFNNLEAQHHEVERVLDLYANASAVVTTRVHAALPCLGFGTPVLLLTRPAAEPRVREAAELVHSCTAEDFLSQRYAFDWKDPPLNPTAHVRLAAALSAACRSFADRLQAVGGQIGSKSE